MDGHGFDATRRKVLTQDLARCFGPAVPAGVEICGRVAMFGPSVEGEVGFLDHDDAGHALGGEPVKNRVHYGRARGNGGISHRRFHALEIIQQRPVAIVKLDEQMTSEGQHGSTSGRRDGGDHPTVSSGETYPTWNGGRKVFVAATRTMTDTRATRPVRILSGPDPRRAPDVSRGVALVEGVSGFGLNLRVDRPNWRNGPDGIRFRDKSVVKVKVRVEVEVDDAAQAIFSLLRLGPTLNFATLRPGAHWCDARNLARLREPAGQLPGASSTAGRSAERSWSREP